MDTQVSIAQRLAQVIESMGITPTEFARQIKVSQPAIALILGGHRSGVSLKMAGKITERYTDISLEWLLFGRGEMLRTHILKEKYVVGAADGDVAAEGKAGYATWREEMEQRVAALEGEVRRLKDAK